jgi:hypothetical protein
MPELLDFDKDLIHLEAASKVFQLLMLCICGWLLNCLLIKYVTEQLNVLIPTDPTEVACGRNASNKQRS